jgi:hypothetical protein
MLPTNLEQLIRNPIDPRDTCALNGCGIVLFRLGRHAEARQSFLAGLGITEDMPFFDWHS